MRGHPRIIAVSHGNLQRDLPSSCKAHAISRCGKWSKKLGTFPRKDLVTVCIFPLNCASVYTSVQTVVQTVQIASRSATQTPNYKGALHMKRSSRMPGSAQ